MSWILVSTVCSAFGFFGYCRIRGCLRFLLGREYLYDLDGFNIDLLQTIREFLINGHHRFSFVH